MERETEEVEEAEATVVFDSVEAMAGKDEQRQ